MSYQGGKQRLGKRIFKVLNKLDTTQLDYLEPFVGFCGVMKHFGNKGDRKLMGRDINKDVIAMWKATQQGWNPPMTCSKEKYKELRDDPRTSAERGFIGVACSYSGIFFVGYRGKQTFRNKSKNGKVKSTVVESAAMTARSVNRMAKMLKNVDFKACKYQSLNPKNMLVYCDPPYASNDYKQNKYFNFDSKEFWGIIRKWSNDNIVVVSEYKAPSDFREIWQSKNDVIHHGKRNIKIEKLFIHKNLYDSISEETKTKIRQI